MTSCGQSLSAAYHQDTVRDGQPGTAALMLAAAANKIPKSKDMRRKISIMSVGELARQRCSRQTPRVHSSTLGSARFSQDNADLPRPRPATASVFYVFYLTFFFIFLPRRRKRRRLRPAPIVRIPQPRVFLSSCPPSSRHLQLLFEVWVLGTRWRWAVNTGTISRTRCEIARPELFRTRIFKITKTKMHPPSLVHNVCIRACRRGRPCDSYRAAAARREPLRARCFPTALP